MDDKALVELAKKARANAYAPYSGFSVGAAVLAADGRVFSGCNIENASYGLTNCAERTAIFSAVAAGARELAALAVVALCAALQDEPQAAARRAADLCRGGRAASSC